MRLWSVHPRHFDRQALTACWREGLLAQAVLAGDTVGYRQHPQLERFRDNLDPLATVGAYLHGIADDADARGYHFDRSRVRTPAPPPRPDTEAPPLTVTTGQLDLEWRHLRTKLEGRSPEVAARWAEVERPEPHPLFRVIDGPVASWERATG